MRTHSSPDLWQCVKPFYCGHAGNDFTCDPDQTDGGCNCVGECEAGHSGQIVCSASGTCDCYFDGDLVATCFDESDGCDFQSSCCIGFMLPGGGPAASGD